MLSSNGVITLIMLSSMMKALHCDELQMSETLFSTQHRNVNQSPILSGFVYVNGIVLKIKRRLNLPSACKSVSFVNVPLNTTSPLMKGNTFDLILEDLYNGRYGWTNGVDYLSYFPSSDDSSPYGTWLLGNKPGIDSGYAYLKPSHDTLVPIDVRQSDWHWLEGKDWEKRPAVKVICNDYPHDQDLKEKEYISSHFYQVEYFVGSTIHSGYYTPAHPEISSQSTLLSSLKKSEQKMLLSLNAPSLWSDTKLDKINTGTGGKFRVLCNVGGATMIVDGSGKSVIGHLIQDEVRGSGSGWSLIFRKVQGALSDEIKSESNSQIEIIVEISSKGSMNGFSLRPLSIEEESDYMMPMKRSLETSKKGDYLWIWYSVLPVEMTQYISSNSADINFDGSTLLGLESRVTSSSKLIEKSVEEETEILLECVARSDSKIIFKYYFADRRDAMRQSVLSKETHYFTYTKKLNSQSDNEGKENSNGIMFDQMNSEIKTNAIFFIGADVIGFIRNYLDYKENWNGLSSCFLYHAAVTLPRPLVYAAEILCVLSGAKAVTMVRTCVFVCLYSSIDECMQMPSLTPIFMSCYSEK